MRKIEVCVADILRLLSTSKLSSCKLTTVLLETLLCYSDLTRSETATT